MQCWCLGWVAGAVLVALLAVVAHPRLWAEMQVTHLIVPVADLPAELEGLKLAQLSDIHHHPGHLEEALLVKAVRTINEWQPDAVLLTGDYVSGEGEHIDGLQHHLKALESKRGTFAIHGNHDVITHATRRRVEDALAQAGATLLHNKSVRPFGHEGLALVGIGDVHQRHNYQPQRAFHGVPEGVPRIVLSHQPDTAEKLAHQQHRIDLQLSGHTHGGQIHAPVIGAVTPIVAYIRNNLLPNRIKNLRMLNGFDMIKHWEWTHGIISVPRPGKAQDNHMYVNSGLGTAPFFRFWCPPEVTLITLTSATRDTTTPFVHKVDYLHDMYNAVRDKVNVL